MTLAFDSTPVEVESEHNDQADPNRKHGYGFHALLVYLDQTGEALGGVPPPHDPEAADRLHGLRLIGRWCGWQLVAIAP